jgi:F420-non-reducing hydrogenase small subunit
MIASQKTLCDECKRKKAVKKIDRIYMPHEIAIDPDKCMLDKASSVLAHPPALGAVPSAWRATSPAGAAWDRPPRCWTKVAAC